jgi:hypothetical protein
MVFMAIFSFAGLGLYPRENGGRVQLHDNMSFQIRAAHEALRVLNVGVRKRQLLFHTDGKPRPGAPQPAMRRTGGLQLLSPEVPVALIRKT